MIENEKKLVGKVILTKSEVGLAIAHLLQENENFEQLSHEDKTEKISNYWLENGKKDCSFLNLISK